MTHEVGEFLGHFLVPRGDHQQYLRMSSPPWRPGGTVALSVDIITAQEIFRWAVAPTAQAAVPSD